MRKLFSAMSYPAVAVAAMTLSTLGLGANAQPGDVEAEFVKRCLRPLMEDKPPHLDGLFRRETVPHEVAKSLRASGVRVPSVWDDFKAGTFLRLSWDPSENSVARCQLHYSTRAIAPQPQNVFSMSGGEWCKVEIPNDSNSNAFQLRVSDEDQSTVLVLFIEVDDDPFSSIHASKSIAGPCGDE